MKILAKFLICLAPFLAAGFTANAKDYLVTASHPNMVHLIDVKARKVVRSMPIPGDGRPETITTTPGGKIAYVLTNHLGTVAGMNLETGKQVFRADFSYDDMRVKAGSAVTVSADGKELFVVQRPTHIMPAEYRVMDQIVAVYDTSAGIEAKPVRSFPVPPGAMQLLASPDGARLYVFGYDLHALDAQTGALLQTYKIRGWDRGNFGQPDILTMWTAPETSGVYAAVYGFARTDMNPADPLANYTGLLLLDLATGELELREYERGGPITFSAVINPVRRNEVYTIYLILSKLDLSKQIDLDANPSDSLVVNRQSAPHTYYNINVSTDGEEIYLGGAMNDIAIYGTAEMDARGTIKLPGGGDMALTFIKMVQWHE